MNNRKRLMQKDGYYIGVGRRKEATARVYLKEGTGQTQVRTKQKDFAIQKIRAEVSELTKSLHNLEQSQVNKKTAERTEKALSVVKFEMEERLIELKKQLKQQKK